MGKEYRPKCIVGGFIAAEVIRYIADCENIHVVQGNIFSQYAVDNQDGDGSICYPYYPSKEHFASRRKVRRISLIVSTWTDGQWISSMRRIAG